ncbi:ABC transporter ATP-binding protein [Paenibacillus eucommiae]|uniref:Peptide/nickel transport system ATP-binding protein n=1 Tax=Paenibacillus eucommiae TaxID=1355755 RepID=A0ABS4JAJ9_9BACL|nr:ATP-binding cassette domain-containing protein [Paenibacillus eucommiae]MBP1996867.1 peptide/nickel transport system ATP-binding protein [Paenibacillus eucommiae]
MLLEGNNLGVRYGSGPWIFREVSVSLRQGEVVGLVGPSGSGKTTLGRLLAGYDKPQEGSVALNGAPFVQRGYHPVQLVLQHPEKAVNPLWRMRRILQEGWAPDPALLEALAIEQAWLDRWPNELSGGELQRCCVARALGPETRFLIADEMTAMLDAISQAQIWSSVLDIVQKRNLGLLIISHEPHLIRRLCSRVIEWKDLIGVRT